MLTIKLPKKAITLLGFMGSKRVPIPYSIVPGILSFSDFTETVLSTSTSLLDKSYTYTIITTRTKVFK